MELAEHPPQLSPSPSATSHSEALHNPAPALPSPQLPPLPHPHPQPAFQHAWLLEQPLIEYDAQPPLQFSLFPSNSQLQPPPQQNEESYQPLSDQHQQQQQQYEATHHLPQPAPLHSQQQQQQVIRKRPEADARSSLGLHQTLKAQQLRIQLEYQQQPQGHKNQTSLSAGDKARLHPNPYLHPLSQLLAQPIFPLADLATSGDNDQHDPFRAHGTQHSQATARELPQSHSLSHPTLSSNHAGHLRVHPPPLLQLEQYASFSSHEYPQSVPMQRDYPNFQYQLQYAPHPTLLQQDMGSHSRARSNSMGGTSSQMCYAHLHSLSGLPRQRTSIGSHHSTPLPSPLPNVPPGVHATVTDNGSSRYAELVPYSGALQPPDGLYTLGGGVFDSREVEDDDETSGDLDGEGESELDTGNVRFPPGQYHPPLVYPPMGDNTAVDVEFDLEEEDQDEYHPQSTGSAPKGKGKAKSKAKPKGKAKAKAKSRARGKGRASGAKYQPVPLHAPPPPIRGSHPGEKSTANTPDTDSPFPGLINAILPLLPVPPGASLDVNDLLILHPPQLSPTRTGHTPVNQYTRSVQDDGEQPPGESGIVPSQYEMYTCRACRKTYDGKNARSVARRHLQDKHGVPLSAQSRRTRWDGDEDRPRNEAEMSERSRKQKRDWAKVNRQQRHLERLHATYLTQFGPAGLQTTWRLPLIAPVYRDPISLEREQLKGTNWVDGKSIPDSDIPKSIVASVQLLADMSEALDRGEEVEPSNFEILLLLDGDDASYPQDYAPEVKGKGKTKLAGKKKKGKKASISVSSLGAAASSSTSPTRPLFPANSNTITSHFHVDRYSSRDGGSSAYKGDASSAWPSTMSVADHLAQMMETSVAHSEEHEDGNAQTHQDDLDISSDPNEAMMGQHQQIWVDSQLSMQWAPWESVVDPNALGEYLPAEGLTHQQPLMQDRPRAEEFAEHADHPEEETIDAIADSLLDLHSTPFRPSSAPNLAMTTGPTGQVPRIEAAPVPTHVSTMKDVDENRTELIWPADLTSLYGGNRRPLPTRAASLQHATMGHDSHSQSHSLTFSLSQPRPHGLSRSLSAHTLTLPLADSLSPSLDDPFVEIITPKHPRTHSRRHGSTPGKGNGSSGVNRTGVKRKKVMLLSPSPLLGRRKRYSPYKFPGMSTPRLWSGGADGLGRQRLPLNSLQWNEVEAINQCGAGESARSVEKAIGDVFGGTENVKDKGATHLAFITPHPPHHPGSRTSARRRSQGANIAPRLEESVDGGPLSEVANKDNQDDGKDRHLPSGTDRHPPSSISKWLHFSSPIDRESAESPRLVPRQLVNEVATPTQVGMKGVAHPEWETQVGGGVIGGGGDEGMGEVLEGRIKKEKGVGNAKEGGGGG